MENETPQEPTNTPPAKKAKILIIEDQRGFRKVYRDVLEPDGYQILEAENGEEGWDMVLTQKPDLILLDLGLPLLDGFQVLERIRRGNQTKTIPVIILSVLGEPRDVKRAMEMGANDYTVKGFFTPRQILSKIKGLLKDKALQFQSQSYRLKLKDDPEASAVMMTDLGLSNGFQCPHCDVEMVMEFFPDFARPDGHWFTARFICPTCGKPF